MPPVRMRGDGRKAKNPAKTFLRLLGYMKNYIPILLVVLSTGGMHSTLVLLLTPTFCSRLFRSGSRGSLVFLCLLFIC